MGYNNYYYCSQAPPLLGGHPRSRGIMACPLGVSLPYKLEPFEYQVGGHFVLMRLGLPGAVCKPSGKRETYFYHTVPEPLREFIPAYHGRRQSGLYLCSPF